MEAYAVVWRHLDPPHTFQVGLILPVTIDVRADDGAAGLVEVTATALGFTCSNIEASFTVILLVRHDFSCGVEVEESFFT